MSWDVTCENSSVLVSAPGFLLCTGTNEGYYQARIPDDTDLGVAFSPALDYVNYAFGIEMQEYGRSDKVNGPFVNNPYAKNGVLVLKHPVKSYFALWLQGVKDTSGKAWFSLYGYDGGSAGISSVAYNTDGILLSDIGGTQIGPVLAFASLFVYDVAANTPAWGAGPWPAPEPSPGPPGPPAGSPGSPAPWTPHRCSRPTFSPDEAGYAVSFPAESLHQPLKGGLGRYRKDFIGVNNRANVQWTLSSKDLAILRLLFEDAGTDPVPLDLYVDSAPVKTSHGVYLIPGTLKYMAQRGTRHTVTAQIEIIRGEITADWPAPL